MEEKESLLEDRGDMEKVKFGRKCSQAGDL